MKKALWFAIGGMVLLVPAVASAAEIFPWPLVPDNCLSSRNSAIDPSGPYYQAADLLTLINNLLAFAVYIAIVIAVIMFIYAGILYVTAAAREGSAGIDKAKKVFWTVFWGLVIVLASWLVVDLVLGVLTGGKGLKPFTAGFSTCMDYAVVTPAKPDPSRSPSVNTAGAVEGADKRTSDQKFADENLARIQLETDSNNRVKVNKPSCAVNQRYQDRYGGCTDISLLDSAALAYAADMSGRCGTGGEACNITITGGSELGHETHGAGGALDIGHSSDLDTTVRSWQEVRPGYYKDPKTGVVWYDEGGNDPHWHLCVVEEKC